MDYAFAPGRSGQDRRLRGLFQRRSNTTLMGPGASRTSSIAVRRAASVEAYIALLVPPNPIPAEKIFIGSHGAAGYMHIPFANVSGSAAPEMATYDTVAEADTQNLCHIPATARDTNTAVRIRGCVIGKSQRFVQRLKESLGNQVPVSAPKHFHLIGSQSNCGFYEAFCYEYEVTKKVAFTGSTRRADIIQEFQGTNFALLNPSISILNNWWEEWVPTSGIPNRAPTRDVRLRVAHRVRFDPPLPTIRRRGNQIIPGNPISTRNLGNVDGMFRIIVDTFTWYKTGVMSRPSQTDMIDQIHDNIRISPRFQGSNSENNQYPEHERYGVSTINEFLELFTWSASYNRRERKINATGVRYKYVAVVPITRDPDPLDRTKNHLIYNFFPDQNNNVPEEIQIVETDSKLFQLV